ncbi:MAG: hypothetical protein IKD47_05005 [Clostridia bacterium]|nr:hypothetical protein [Clostridia bacterium]
MNDESMMKETDALKRLCSSEDLAEKKLKIYSRLLTDVTLAKDMERLAIRHEKRKETLTRLVYGKAKKTTKTGGEA